MRLSRRWRSEDGAQLVEFALVLPLLLFVVLGIAEFGFIFQRYEVVTNAAREGARIAVLPGYAISGRATRVRNYLTLGGVPVTVGNPASCHARCRGPAAAAIHATGQSDLHPQLHVHGAVSARGLVPLT